MSQRDLISNLFACFKEFEFWSIKSLRAKLNQPDVWLREGLSEVATLVTHGTNSGKWTLKPDYKPMVQGDLDQMEAALEKAATGGGVGSGTGEMPIEIDDDDEEEEEVEMEDVI